MWSYYFAYDCQVYFFSLPELVGAQSIEDTALVHQLPLAKDIVDFVVVVEWEHFGWDGDRTAEN